MHKRIFDLKGDEIQEVTLESPGSILMRYKSYDRTHINAKFLVECEIEMMQHIRQVQTEVTDLLLMYKTLDKSLFHPPKPTK